MIPVRLIGRAARRALAPGLPPEEGKVLAVFRRSIYLERAGGALACLGPPALGAGPLNALCGMPEGFEWEEKGIVPGMPFRCGGEEVRLGRGVSFVLRDARDWKAQPPLPGWRAEDLAENLAALAREAQGRAPAEGLGRLITSLVQGGTPPLAPPCQGRERRAAPPCQGGDGGGGFLPGKEGSFLLHAALAGALALGEWLSGCLRGEDSPPPEEAKALIGLGPGLTPSGDDCLGGALVALRALGEGRAADRLAAWALPLAEGRTGKISLAHLRCAAAGEGASALHEALAALCVPGAAGLPEALDAIHAIGHTSGWDALAGAAGACAAWLHAGRPGFEGRAPAPV
ncbi:MAG: DUF2877 domain-containing protein [Nitrospinota bacterium]